MGGGPEDMEVAAGVTDGEAGTMARACTVPAGAGDTPADDTIDAAMSGASCTVMLLETGLGGC